ncbi:MAG: VWA domain-containing protein [Ignavibacteriales bacterium]|nr:VWA domain-containing protein [Ignavibacteriales bacterium]
MKRYILFTLLFALITASQANGHFFRLVYKPKIDFHGYLNRTCIPHRGGVAYLNISINTPALETRNRKPMNLSVVLDRSGSMADARKIDYAKSAISHLIDNLTGEDYFSLVMYDDQIDILVSPQQVRDKRRLKNIVNEIYPNGSTNLGGGMIEGFRQAEHFVTKECVNRVILLSDGLANQGITDQNELNRIASRYRSKSISLSTMGVGLDYNENLMLGLAEHGGGNYYYIESPNQLSTIFERELKGLSAIVAQNASVELELGRGVTVNDVIGCKWNRARETWVIPLGDLYGNEHRELTVELNIPEGTGTKRVATGTLKYESRKMEVRNFPSFSVEIRYSDDVAELDKSTNLDVQGKIEVALSTRKVEQAMEAYDAGDEDEAAMRIEEARSMIQSSKAITNSAASPMMQEQLQSLETYSKELKDESKDKRARKKSIQYKNYQIQKKK